MKFTILSPVKRVCYKQGDSPWELSSDHPWTTSNIRVVRVRNYWMRNKWKKRLRKGGQDLRPQLVYEAGTRKFEKPVQEGEPKEIVAKPKVEAPSYSIFRELMLHTGATGITSFAMNFGMTSAQATKVETIFCLVRMLTTYP